MKSRVVDYATVVRESFWMRTSRVFTVCLRGDSMNKSDATPIDFRLTLRLSLQIRRLQT
jgi:hypothetical protein